MIPILRAGAPARYDSCTGLIPVRVLRVYVRPGSAPHGWRSVDARVTRDHGPYRKGETLTDLPARYVVPVRAIRRRKYSTRITAYEVQEG